MGEMVAKRWGADEAQVGIEGDEATVEGTIVKGIEGDAVLRIETVLLRDVPRDDPSIGSGQVVRGHQGSNWTVGFGTHGV